MPLAPTPVNGIDRKMLERDGDEVARATSLVRYASHSSFTSHQHGWVKNSLYSRAYLKMSSVNTLLAPTSRIQLVLDTRHSQKRVARCLSNSDTKIPQTILEWSSTPNRLSGVKVWFQGLR